MTDPLRFVTTRRTGGGGKVFWWQPPTRVMAAAKGTAAETWVRLTRLGETGPGATGTPVAVVQAAAQLNDQLDRWRAQTGTLPAPSREAAGARTMAAVVADYRVSTRWAKLAPKTRYEYERCLSRILSWCGDQPVLALTPQRLARYYQTLRFGGRPVAELRRMVAEAGHRLPRSATDEAVFIAAETHGIGQTLHEAAAVMRVFRVVLGHAVFLQWLPTNPASSVALSVPETTPRFWTPAGIAAMVEASTVEGVPSIGAFVEINAWLGQREADVLALPRDFDVQGTWTITQRKRRQTVHLPVGMVSELGAAVQRLRADQDARGIASLTHLFLAETTGRPWKGDHFRHAFARVRARAMATCPEITADHCAMHLRHTAVLEMSLAGCTPQLIASVTGHSLQTVVAIMDRAYWTRTEEQAALAFQARLNRRR